MSNFKLKEIRRSKREYREFAQTLIELVPYMKHNNLEEEIEIIQKYRNIRPFWIKNDLEQDVGTVKIRRDSTFFGFGLRADLTLDEVKQIFDIIENEINFWFANTRLYATVSTEYIDMAIAHDYKIEFSRYKMLLDLNKIKCLAPYDDLDLIPYDEKYFPEMVECFIDAYSGTIDEKIGMFSATIAHNAIRSIFEGKFGVFKTELSVLYVNANGNLVGASLITISEGNPLIVIVGVRRDEQGKSLGRKMLSANIELCKKYDYDRLTLWVTKENSTALGLYESIGFIKQYQIYSIFKH